MHGHVETRHIEAEQRSDSGGSKNSFFNFLTVLATPHTEWEIEDLPYNLRIHRDHVYSDDQPDRRVGSGSIKTALHAKYGIDTKKGAIVVVRPDGYVGASVTMDQDGYEALGMYFAGFLKSSRGPTVHKL